MDCRTEFEIGERRVMQGLGLGFPTALAAGLSTARHARNAQLWSFLATVATGAAGDTAEQASYYAGAEKMHGTLPVGVKYNPALKLICLIPRPEKISPKEFHEYWLEKHAPLVKSVSSVLRMKRYVQSHLVYSPTIDGFGGGRSWTPNPYSGVTEVWWESEKDMADAFASPDGVKASALLADDERNFSDSKVVVFAATEYEIFK